MLIYICGKEKDHNKYIEREQNKNMKDIKTTFKNTLDTLHIKKHCLLSTIQKNKKEINNLETTIKTLQLNIIDLDKDLKNLLDLEKTLMDVDFKVEENNNIFNNESDLLNLSETMLKLENSNKESDNLPNEIKEQSQN